MSDQVWEGTALPSRKPSVCPLLRLMPTLTSTPTGNREWFIPLTGRQTQWGPRPGLLFLWNLPELRIEP